MISPEVLFALVDRHVTASMADAAYAKIGEYDEVTDSAGGVPLVARRWTWMAPQRWLRRTHLPFLRASSPTAPKERVLRVGYECSTQDDEKWLSYCPDTDQLDLTDWRDELEPHVDWSVWSDQAVPTAEELERRLRLVGTVMTLGRPSS